MAADNNEIAMVQTPLLNGAQAQSDYLSTTREDTDTKNERKTYPNDAIELLDLPDECLDLISKNSLHKQIKDSLENALGKMTGNDKMFIQDETKSAEELLSQFLPLLSNKPLAILESNEIGKHLEEIIADLPEEFENDIKKTCDYLSILIKLADNIPEELKSQIKKAAALSRLKELFKITDKQITDTEIADIRNGNNDSSFECLIWIKLAFFFASLITLLLIDPINEIQYVPTKENKQVSDICSSWTYPPRLLYMIISVNICNLIYSVHLSPLSLDGYHSCLSPRYKPKCFKNNAPVNRQLFTGIIFLITILVPWCILIALDTLGNQPILTNINDKHPSTEICSKTVDTFTLGCTTNLYNLMLLYFFLTFTPYTILCILVDTTRAVLDKKIEHALKKQIQKISLFMQDPNKDDNDDIEAGMTSLSA